MSPSLTSPEALLPAYTPQVRGVALIGPRGFIAERLAVFAEAGVTTMLVRPATADPREAVRYVEELLQLLPS